MDSLLKCPTELKVTFSKGYPPMSQFSNQFEILPVIKYNWGENFGENKTGWMEEETRREIMNVILLDIIKYWIKR